MQHEFKPAEQLGFLRDMDLPRHRAARIDVDRRSPVLGARGCSMLSDSVRCVLVGLFDEGRELATRAAQWLELAIAVGEIPHRYFPHGTEARRHDSLAMSRWLVDGVHDSQSLKLAADEEFAYLDIANRDKIELTLALPIFIDAECYQQAITLFESTKGLKRPTHPLRVTSEAGICYLIAKHRLGLESEQLDLQQAIRYFLQAKLAEMLADCRYIDVARWMKIAHWRPGQDSVNALLHAYDYLPNLTLPPYPASDSLG